ncbi:Predicted pyrophosphatase or phosphodiesterase, AlkP superfamily [Shimia gijangensis]|uniref:Predicted pyrophosphatase or phosphodiesterase, AlkP superfamily n=1 Tax=Shimia gijangensis TaxID=1470563 RepID=A0A1M6CR43_9RHOB|nr:alkaline phosphatase family protein [Shimia gijangensis]SHI63429.1 Predicted pyrophosphatase or phosphodiesterase, AlkP superfamily [Shimia gijangensis]
MTPTRFTATTVAALLLATSLHAETTPPKLIVQITVDGLRADLLSRYEASFVEGGFRRLMEQGVWYTNAHHQHANTETIVGHATLSTGAHPSAHGMIGNAWMDRGSGKLAYNIEDQDYPMLPVAGMEGDGDQVDPSQDLASSDGRSPRNLLSTTFADELVKSTNGRAKVFGISSKDRSAVAMAGHAGKAFWMSTSTGAYESSEYYYEAYPKWVLDWNAKRPADVAIGTDWALSSPLDSYLLAENDDRPYEVDLKGYGRTFPHSYEAPKDGLYYTQVVVSPLGDQLTADFAKAAILNEGLGHDDTTDYLSVSFSGVDAVNHFFGPSSLENEEVTRSLDAVLEQFFEFVDLTVGAENVVYVLSADHGMPELPEFVGQRGFKAERMFAEDLQDDLNALLLNTFGIDNAVKYFFRPYIYLDHDAIREAAVDKRDVERLIVDTLTDRSGIAVAMPIPPFADQVGHPLEVAIRNNYNQQRSGDIYVAQSPYAFLVNKSTLAAMHGSPWAYDTHVPMIFAGPDITPRKISRSVATTDVAVTLSTMLGITLPSAASGNALEEVLR